MWLLWKSHPTHPCCLHKGLLFFCLSWTNSVLFVMCSPWCLCSVSSVVSWWLDWDFLKYIESIILLVFSKGICVHIGTHLQCSGNLHYVLAFTSRLCGAVGESLGLFWGFLQHLQSPEYSLSWVQPCTCGWPSFPGIYQNPIWTSNF